jgi:hypothetical protein
MQKTKRKLIAAVLLISMLFVFFPRPTHADIWGESIFAAMGFKQMLEQMWQRIHETLVAALKTAAIKMILSQLSSMMGGGKTGVGPIGDWRQFIYGSAQQYSMQQTSTFFKTMSSGTPAPLTQRIITPAQTAVMTDPFSMRPDLQNYVREGRADMIFQPGYAQNPLVAFTQAAKPQNSLGFMFMRGVDKMQLSYNSQAEVKKAEGVAGSGFQSKKSGGTPGNPDSGKITTPGSSQKDISSKIQGSPVDRITAAQSMPDVIAAMVSQVLAQMLNKGFSMATSQLGKVTGSGMGSLGSLGNIGNIQNMIQRGIK